MCDLCAIYRLKRPNCLGIVESESVILYKSEIHVFIVASETERARKLPLQTKLSKTASLASLLLLDGRVKLFPLLNLCLLIDAREIKGPGQGA